MNLGSIWDKLTHDDRIIIAGAINRFGRIYIHSYLHKHRYIKFDDPKLVFIKLKPVLRALTEFSCAPLVEERRIKLIAIIREYIKQEYLRALK